MMMKAKRGAGGLLGTLAIALVWAAPGHAQLIDNGDGTVTQIRPGYSPLMWLQDANYAATSGYPGYITVSEYCYTPSPASCFSIYPQTGLSHADALIWASTLDFAGYTDWRMPTGLNPDGTGPFIGYSTQGASGEMLDLSLANGIWRDAPGPFTNVKLNYWTGSSGIDFDDGIWDFLPGIFGQAILQSKLTVVGPDAWVDTRYPAWAVRDLPLTDCSDGIDNDGDGFTDVLDDPGCEDVADLSESSPLLVCDDGADNDNDGLVDFPSDPGCIHAASGTENSQCQDGADNDGDGSIDFDGGASLNGGVPIAAADPQCGTSWQNREAAQSCGLGFELALLLPALAWLRVRRRRGS